MFTPGRGGTIRVRDVRAGVETRTIQGLSDDVQALMFNPDGIALAQRRPIRKPQALGLRDRARDRGDDVDWRLYVRKIRFSRDGKSPGCRGNHFVPCMTG